MADFLKDLKLNKQEVGQILSLDEEHKIVSTDHSIEELEEVLDNISDIQSTISSQESQISKAEEDISTNTADIASAVARIDQLEEDMGDTLNRLKDLNGEED